MLYCLLLHAAFGIITLHWKGTMIEYSGILLLLYPFTDGERESEKETKPKVLEDNSTLE